MRINRAKIDLNKYYPFIFSGILGPRHMDMLLDIETVSVWLDQYGSFALFALLALGIIAFPVPEETLLMFSGILIQKGSLPLTETVIAALSGSICGITASYFLGMKIGHYFFSYAGKWIGINQSHLDKAHAWFERFGKWTLFIGYFIPGVRHFTGFSAGMSRLYFQEFALFAYSGAIVWVATFLSIGYFFGNYGLALFENLESSDQLLIALFLLIIAAYVFYLYRKKKRQK